MKKAQDLLLKLGGTIKESDDKDDEKDKDLVPINEPEEDSYPDLHVDDEEEKEDKPDEFAQSVIDKFKHAKDPDEDFDAEQLAAGIKVEMEHMNDKWVAMAVAKAHLFEFPPPADYYKALAEMETKLKKEKDDKKEEPKEDEDDI